MEMAFNVVSCYVFFRAGENTSDSSVKPERLQDQKEKMQVEPIMDNPITCPKERAFWGFFWKCHGHRTFFSMLGRGGHAEKYLVICNLQLHH